MYFLIFVFILVIILYIYNIRTFKYWDTKGIKFEKPVLFFGSYSDVYLLKQSRSQMAEEVYWKYPNEKVVGVFKSTTPELVIRDPELIKTVLVSDFPAFYSRGFIYSNDVEVLRRHLFAIDGDLWRMLRQRMTPAFTSGKLKAMFPLIVERCEKLQSRTLAAAARNEPLDARELMARYTTDFIGACGFGVDSDSLNDENSAFRQLGAKMFKATWGRVIVGTMKEFFPRLDKRIKIFANVEEEVLSLVKQIIHERNFKPCGRNDFIDLMLEHLYKPMELMIPVQALHMDPKYWDNPQEFRPERFHPDNFGAKQKMVYFPFGEGPRNCIGSRLGLMQSMAGLAAILAKFTVEPAPTTVRYPKIDPKSNVVQSILGGLPLMFRKRDIQ